MVRNSGVYSCENRCDNELITTIGIYAYVRISTKLYIGTYVRVSRSPLETQLNYGFPKTTSRFDEFSFCNLFLYFFPVGVENI